MTKELLKKVLSEDKFKGEFIKYENGIFTYESKLKFCPNEDRIMVNKYVSFEIPIESVKDKTLTAIIEDVEEIYEYAVF